MTLFTPAVIAILLNKHMQGEEESSHTTRQEKPRKGVFNVMEILEKPQKV